MQDPDRFDFRFTPLAISDIEEAMNYIPDKTIRHIRVGNYILIYEVVDEKRVIHILRFRYAKMDFTNIEMK